MGLDIEGIFLRKDFSEVITESFAKQYAVNLDSWILPFGYYDEYNCSIISNGSFPDGTYVLLGKMNYPGADRGANYSIAQFNLLRSRGLEINFINKFRPYPNVPKELPFCPKYPLFRVGDVSLFKKIKHEFLEIEKNYWTPDEINSKIKELKPDSELIKICSLKLALIRFLYLLSKG